MSIFIGFIYIFSIEIFYYNLNIFCLHTDKKLFMYAKYGDLI